MGIVVTSLKDSLLRRSTAKIYLFVKKKNPILKKFVYFLNMQDPNRTRLKKIIKKRAF